LLSLRKTHGSFAAVQLPFQDEGLHRLLERLENSDQMVVLPREEAFPSTRDLSKGTVIWVLVNLFLQNFDVKVGGFSAILPYSY
jgi:hypothetical protein